jgi:hypothetical protein
MMLLSQQTRIPNKKEGSINRFASKKNGIKTAAAIFALLYALGQSGAYAASEGSSNGEKSSKVKTKIISGIQHVENFYNAFGVCYMSTDHSTTVTQTTDGDTTSTTTQDSVTMQTWKGGSLKADYTNSTSDTTGDDGSSSHTVSKTTYEYDENGKLAGASGTATTTGTLAEGANGESGGEYTSTQTTSYTIKNAQALPSQTTTHTVQTLEGQVSVTSDEVTTFSYELLGGSWRLMQEVSNSISTTPDGGRTETTTTKTYSRDANGLCTGLSQTMTGTRTVKTATGGTETWTLSAGDYTATPSFDEEQGWYISKVEYDWKLNSSADTSSASDTQSVESANEKLIKNSGSDASDSGSDPAAGSDNASGNKKKIMPVYNEKRQTELENQILKSQKAAQQREGKSAKEVSAFHKKARQQQAELEKQLVDFRRASKERREQINRQIEQFERNFGVQFHHFLYN